MHITVSCHLPQLADVAKWEVRPVRALLGQPSHERADGLCRKHSDLVGGPARRLGGGEVTQEVSLGADLRITQVRRFRGTDLWWEVMLDDFDDASGQQMPRRLRLSAPADKIQVEVQLKERVWGKPTSPTAFQLTPPKGAKIEDVE